MKPCSYCKEERQREEAKRIEEERQAEEARKAEEKSLSPHFLDFLFFSHSIFLFLIIIHTSNETNHC